MQIHHVGCGIRGFYRAAKAAQRALGADACVERRLKILDFWHTHGLPATIDAFGVSRRTLFRWQKTLADAGGRPIALARKSTTPPEQQPWGGTLSHFKDPDGNILTLFGM